MCDNKSRCGCIRIGEQTDKDGNSIWDKPEYMTNWFKWMDEFEKKSRKPVRKIIVK